MVTDIDPLPGPDEGAELDFDLDLELEPDRELGSGESPSAVGAGWLRRRRAVSPSAVRDSMWLDRIRAGDAAAFEALFVAYTPRLCDFIVRYVHSREEAQEVVQDLFVWLWQHRAELVVRGLVASYLYTAARHRAINRLRRERVRERWRSRVLRGSEDDGNAEPPGVEAELELAERLAAIERAVAELPERRRAVCVLRWSEGLSYAAIAQRLGISEKTVDGQLQRAIQHVRRALRDL